MQHVSYEILLLLSIGVFGGMLGGILFQRLRIPQVIGYIAVGLLLGQTGIGYISHQAISSLQLFNFFALGVIGFLVGGELKLSTFRRYARSYTLILLGEGGLAFIFVGIGSFVILHFVLHNMQLAMAGALVLGAIASATDPASTIDVLWEYRARGVLTTSIIAIVALDDALAMTLYAMGTAGAQLLAGGDVAVVEILRHLAVELGGALVLGAAGALLLAGLLKLMQTAEKGVAMALAFIMLIIAAAIAFEMDVILGAMMLGFTLTNVAPRRSHRVFELLRNFSIPIYVMFFVLVGARIRLQALPAWVWLTVAVYVVGRTAGKMLGAWWGGKLSKADDVVCKYLGLGLFAQGGVAIGLSILATQSLNKVMLSGELSLGSAIIGVVTTTTLIVQILGPPAVKLAIKLSNEIGKDRKPEDILRECPLSQVMDKEPVILSYDLPVAEALRKIQQKPQGLFPVVDKEGKLLSVFTMNDLREILTEPEEWQWLLLADVITGEKRFLPNRINALEAQRELQATGLEAMPVCDEAGKVTGLVSLAQLRAYLQQSAFFKKEEETNDQSESPETSEEDDLAQVET